MKKLIFIFFLAGIVYAQDTDKATLKTRMVLDTTPDSTRYFSRHMTPTTKLIINNNSATDTMFVSPNGLFPDTNTSATSKKTKEK